MNHSDIEHMAQGYPPSHIGKDYEEVVTWLATQLLATQHQRDALAAKGMELAREAAHVYEKYNVTQMPDMDLVDGQTIQEFSDLAGGTTSTDAFLNSVRAEGVEMLTAKLQAHISGGDFVGEEIAVISGAVDAGADIAAQLRASKDGE